MIIYIHHHHNYSHLLHIIIHRVLPRRWVSLALLRSFHSHVVHPIRSTIHYDDDDNENDDDGSDDIDEKMMLIMVMMIIMKK